MRLLFWCLLLATACASPQEDLRAEADQAFRMGRYHDAYATYTRIEERTPELEAQTEEARFQSILLSARQRVHVNEIGEALLLLDHAEAERPQEPAIEELREQAYRRKAAELAESGELLLDDGYASAAQRTFDEALRWHPGNEAAQRGLAQAERIVGARGVRGEDLYFEGLNQVLEGRDTRARTAFAHASQLLDDGRRAEERLEALSRDLAVDMVRQAEMRIDHGDVGGAWVLLSDAVRLDPDNDEAATLAAQVDRELEARRLLADADLHVRGGRLSAAEALLDRVLEVTGDGYGARVEAMRSRAVSERARRDYQRARAYELDNQIVRAVEAYDEILRLTEGYGYEDLKLRIDNLRQRVELAGVAYRKALEAEAAGDFDTYRQALEDTVELAGDYEDALERYRSLSDG